MIETHNCEILLPKKTWIGSNCFEQAVKELKKKGRMRGLIVTDKFLAESWIGAEVCKMLSGQEIHYHVYNGVKADPDIGQVTEGTRQYLSNRCDFILSLGGGSAHDCAKAMKLALIRNPETESGQVYFAAVNTTAGTGSEVTKIAIVTDEQRAYKLSLIDEDVIPDMAVNEPRYMADMPPQLTAATGMDALTHAVESYVSVGRNPLTESLSLKAISLVHQFLKKAYRDGSNIEAREGMAYAQYIAGLAFSNSGLGLVHAMAHQLGGLFHIPHGVCNAVLLPFVTDYNAEVCRKEYAEIAAYIGLCPASLPLAVKVKRWIQYLFECNREMGLPVNLKGYGVKVGDAGRLAVMALEDPSLAYNPRKITEEQLKQLFQTVITGGK